MNEIERIKKITLLTTYKGLGDNGKKCLWYPGTWWDGKEKPFPKTILKEVRLRRIGVLDIEYHTEPQPAPVVLKVKNEPKTDVNVKVVPETTPDSSQDDKEGQPKRPKLAR